MEDIGDILFYIIAAVIGLITTLGRKKRKAAKIPAPAATPDPMSDDNISTRVDGSEVEYFVNDDDFLVDDLAAEQLIAGSDKPEKEFVFDSNLEGAYKEPLAEQFVDEGVSELEEEDENMQSDDNKEAEENDIISEFDLRRAVIYSEILNRKDY